MNKIINYLHKNYKNININFKEKLINGNQFIKEFHIDDELTEYEDIVIINKDIYITCSTCIEIIKKHNMVNIMIDLGMIFQCDKCRKTFGKKTDLERHKEKKNKCDKKHLYCEDCDFTYSTGTLLKKHLKSQKHQKNIINKQKKDNSTHIGENITNNKNSKITQNIVSGNKNNFSDSSINIDKIILNYNDPKNIESLTEEDKFKVLNGFVSQMILDLIKKIRFDKNKPQTQNIRQTNQQSKKVYVYQDNDWHLRKIKEISEELLEMHGKDLRHIFQKYKLELPKEKIDEITKYVESLNVNNIIKTVHLDKNFDANTLMDKVKEYSKKREVILEQISDIIHRETKKLGLKKPYEKEINL